MFYIFCGGESLEECKKITNKLSNANIKTILDLSTEDKNDDLSFQIATNRICNAIKYSKQEGIPFCVVKPTGIARFKLLHKTNFNRNISSLEKQELIKTKERLNLICKEANSSKIPLLFDAEESWIQTACDKIILNLQRKFNLKQAIVFNTLQMYKKGSLKRLKNLLQTAKNEQFKLGIKLVRGAYMEKERERAFRKGYPSPINPDKKTTDAMFNKALEICLDNIEVISVFIGTHNEKSCILGTKLMHQKHIKKNDERIYFSQLYGMSDHISFNLAKKGYNVIKYVPYGPVLEVLPYLIRRAQENTSVAGQTSRELTLIKKEIARRKKL